MTDPRLSLRRNRDTATGLSFVAGEPVVGVTDLPEHHVEIHAFGCPQAAEGFTIGLSLSPANAIAWTWEPGRKTGNHHVIVARLDHDRPSGETVAEVIAVIDHPRNTWDSRDLKLAMDEIHADRERQYAADKERRAPLVTALAAAGVKICEQAQGWIRLNDGTVIERKHDDTYTVRAYTDYHRVDGDGGLVERYAAHFAALGFALKIDDPSELVKKTVATPEAAVSLAQEMASASKGMEPIAKAFWHERFMADLKVTKRFRAFLLGAQGGIVSTWHRGDQSLSAGGVTLKRTDINTLTSAAWIHKIGQTYAVTPAGIAAATVPDAPRRL